MPPSLPIQFASRNETTETQLGIHLRRLQEQGKFITQVEDAFADERGTGSHRGYLMVYACKQLDNKMVDALLQLRDLTSIQLRDTMQVRIFRMVLTIKRASYIQIGETITLNVT